VWQMEWLEITRVECRLRAEEGGWGVTSQGLVVCPSHGLTAPNSHPPPPPSLGLDGDGAAAQGVEDEHIGSGQRHRNGPGLPPHDGRSDERDGAFGHLRWGERS